MVAFVPRWFLLAGVAAMLSPLATAPLYMWAGPEALYAPTSIAHHAAAIALHMACVWVAWSLFTKLLPARSAVIAALVFALHPIQVEPAAAAEGLRPLLAALASLSAWRLWVGGRFWTAAAVFVAAAASHHSAAALPFVLAVLEYGTERRTPARLPLAVMTAVSALALWARAGVSFDFFAYQGVALLRMLWVVMVPIGLAPVPDVRAAPWAASLAWGVIAVIALLSIRGVRAAQEGFWLLAALLLALPEFSFFSAADLASGRRFYLPMAACAALAGLMLRQTPRLVLVIAGVLFLAITASQALLWRNETSLWMESARLSPRELRPQLELARLLNPRQAIELLEETAQNHPNDARALAGLGLAYQRAGRYADAQLMLESALRRSPCDGRVREAARGAGIADLPACRSTSVP